MTGKADYLALGDWNAQCYECGRKFKASQLIRHWQGYYVCKDHWEPRQPQDFVRAVPDQQTPPWTQPMPTDSFGTARLSTSGTTAGNSGIVSSILYIVDIPWTPSGTTITNFVLTDYITPPSSWGSNAGSSTAGSGTGTGAADGTGWGSILVNIPNGTVITGSFSFGSGWPAADANGNGGTEFLVNNNGDVRVTPTFPTNINVTRDGTTYNNPVDTPSYTLDWRFGQFPPPRLLFTVQPSNVNKNTAISPAMQVSVVGNLSVVIDTLIFTVGLEIGANPGTPVGTLSGTTSAATSSGVATFSAVQIDEAGDGYTLNAGIDGTNIADVASTEFNVNESWALVSGYVDQGGGDYSYGYNFAAPVLGSITPNTFNAISIKTLLTAFTSGAFSTTFILAGSQTQAVFTSIVVGATTLTSASASYTDAGTFTIWTWAGSNVFSAETTYTAVIT